MTQIDLIYLISEEAAIPYTESNMQVQSQKHKDARVQQIFLFFLGGGAGPCAIA